MQKQGRASDRQFQLALGAIVAAAATFVFFSTPLMEFADAAILSYTGMLMALGIAAFGFTPLSKRNENWSLALLICGLIMGAYAISVAVTRYNANERRCEALQVDMLASSQRRSDDADLFQALRCRPTAAGDVHFPHAITDQGQVHSRGSQSDQDGKAAIRKTGK